MHFKSLLERIQPLGPYPPLPILEDRTVEGVRCEDHLTFIVPWTGKSRFVDFWRDYAFRVSFRMDSWETTEFPATHYALTDNGEVSNCADMIWASVPLVDDSPINKAFELYGSECVVETENDGKWGIPGLPQHLAYSLAKGHSMWTAKEEIERLGFEFFTNILVYKADNGAQLLQAFFGCTAPYGPFGELIQRIPAINGEPFKGFSPKQIDDLYRHYVKHSEELLKA